jgi:alpha-D-xyloside xylohydrolase
MKEGSVIFQRQALVLLGSAMLAAIFPCAPFTDVHAQARLSSPGSQAPSVLEIKTAACVLVLRPLTPTALRIRCAKPGSTESPSLILTAPVSKVPFDVQENATTIVLTTAKMSAIFDRHTETLQFASHAGKAFLSEIEGTRILNPTTVQGEPTFLAEQAFSSPPDEYLFGSGEFQDGYLNVRDLPRRLTQVNSQISIPFLLSSKGYGILWHNNGLTDLNPAGNHLLLARSGTGKETTIDVTTSQGTRKVTRREGEFVGDLDIPQNGRYAMMLDVGQKMAKRYHVEIDGKTAIDFANYWLPPTTSWFMNLSAGRHKVCVVGEDKSQSRILM